jgi:hypothetical protein
MFGPVIVVTVRYPRPGWDCRPVAPTALRTAVTHVSEAAMRAAASAAVGIARRRNDADRPIVCFSLGTAPALMIAPPMPFVDGAEAGSVGQTFDT